MIELSKEEQKYLRQIASFYGCKVKFRTSMLGGMWCGNHIELGTKYETVSGSYRVFFHELGHFVNWKTGKFPIYHNPKNFNRMHKLFPHYEKMIRYSLQAEIATEKTGADLMKTWISDRRLKFKPYYKNTKVCFEFLYGYYLRG